MGRERTREAHARGPGDVSDGSEARTAATLIFAWGAAVSVLVVVLGLFWRSAVGFVAIALAWLILTSPLMVRTARWLASHDVD